MMVVQASHAGNATRLASVARRVVVALGKRHIRARAIFVRIG
jgi:hypothetical protein